MTLAEFESLKTWHEHHRRRQPLEKHAWDMVLTFWLVGCVGIPTAFVVHAGWAEVTCFLLLFLPSVYVAVRRHLHRMHLLRCDWTAALRR